MEHRAAAVASRGIELALQREPFTADDVRRGALTVVNLGDDADTTGRCTGKSLAPLYGAQAIPDAWASRLATRDEIEALLGHLVMQCIDAAS
jgi:ADP-ribosylglycohydrolase